MAGLVNEFCNAKGRRKFPGLVRAASRSQGQENPHQDFLIMVLSYLWLQSLSIAPI